MPLLFPVDLFHLRGEGTHAHHILSSQEHDRMEDELAEVRMLPMGHKTFNKAHCLRIEHQ